VKKVARIKGICSRPLQARYLAAGDEEREVLRGLVEKESLWMIRKMARRGYRLEATVAGVYGVFTRGPAEGTIELRVVEAEALTA